MVFNTLTFFFQVNANFVDLLLDVLYNHVQLEIVSLLAINNFLYFFIKQIVSF